MNINQLIFNKTYILKNILDENLYFKNKNEDTRAKDSAMTFGSRSLAEKFILKNNLSENYKPTVCVHLLDEDYEEHSVKFNVNNILSQINEMLDFSIEYLNKAKGNLNEDIEEDNKYEVLKERLIKTNDYLQNAKIG